MNLVYRDNAGASIASPVFAPLLGVQANIMRCTGYVPERSSLHDRLLAFDARAERWLADGVHAIIDDTPFSISTVAWHYFSRLTYTSSIHVRGAARTCVAVPRSIRLTVKPRTLLRAFLARTRLVTECPVDLPEATHELLVTGDASVARAALGHQALEALLAMRGIMGELVIADGILTLTWQTDRFDAASLLPSAVVVALREMSRGLAALAAARRT